MSAKKKAVKKTASKKPAKKTPAKKTAAKKAPAKKGAPSASAKKGAPKHAPKAAKKGAATAAKKAAPKSAPKKKKSAPKGATKSAAAKVAKKDVPRRDGAGHLNPKYAAELRALSGEREDLGNDTAFLKESRSSDGLAEQLGEEAVETMTSGEDEGEDVLNQDVDEELGGPFVVTSSNTEFAQGTDASNPKGAKREPFPRT